MGNMKRTIPRRSPCVGTGTILRAKSLIVNCAADTQAETTGMNEFSEHRPFSERSGGGSVLQHRRGVSHKSILYMDTVGELPMDVSGRGEPLGIAE